MAIPTDPFEQDVPQPPVVRGRRMPDAQDGDVGDRGNPPFHVVAISSNGGHEVLTPFDMPLLTRLKVLAILQMICGGGVVATCWVPYVVPSVSGLLALVSALAVASRCRSLSSVVYDSNVDHCVKVSHEKVKLYVIIGAIIIAGKLNGISVGLMSFAYVYRVPTQQVVSIVCAVLCFLVSVLSSIMTVQFFRVLSLYDRLVAYRGPVTEDNPQSDPLERLASLQGKVQKHGYYRDREPPTAHPRGH